jgi:hypothetical protein
VIIKSFRVLFRCGKYLVIFALIANTGTHWAVLQTVAWTTMLANNLCEQSMTGAVASTFDGRHPCCLCKAIAAAKKSEKKNELALELIKMEFPPAHKNFTPAGPPEFHLLPGMAAFADSLAQKPPTPPPRGFFV